MTGRNRGAAPTVNTRAYSNILVLILAVLQGVRTLGRRRRSADPLRILIAHHLLLGDTLMLTPLLAKLREQFPRAAIVMTTPVHFVPLYRSRPYGVEALPYDPRNAATMMDLLKHSGFDVAFVPGDNRYSWLALALGARWIVAFAGDRPAYKSWPVDEYVSYSASPAACGDMLAHLAEGDAPSAFRPDAWGDPEYRPFDLPRSPYCVLHLGARISNKLWGTEKWADLAAYLTRHGFTVVWSGGPGEERLVSAVDPNGRHVSYAGKLDLAQLWQLLKRAKLLVCPDTGVAHLGRVANVPTVTLFGPGSAVVCGAGEFWRQSPYHAVSVDDYPCRDQKLLFKREITWLRTCSRDNRECANNLCMQVIDLAMVVSAVDRMLAREPNGTSARAEARW